MNQSEQIDQLATALCAAQAEMKPADKDATNPFFNSKYATLQSIWNACKKPLVENGLSVVQITKVENDRIFLITRLLHISGQWIEGVYPIYYKDISPQSIASAVSYARRYSLSAMVGVVSDEDDDGNAATHGSSHPVEPPLQRVQSQGAQKSSAISEKQFARLVKIAGSNGYTDKDVNDYCVSIHKVNANVLPWKVYEQVVNHFSHPKTQSQQQPSQEDMDFFA